MKKIVVVLLSIALLFCLCACGGGVSETAFQKAIDGLNEKIAAQDKKLEAQNALIAALRNDSDESQAILDNLVKNSSILKFEGTEITDDVLRFRLEDYNKWVIVFEDVNIDLKFPVDLLDIHTEYYIDGVLSPRSMIYRSGFFTQRVSKYEITECPGFDGNLNVTFKYRIIGYILN